MEAHASFASLLPSAGSLLNGVDFHYPADYVIKKTSGEFLWKIKIISGQNGPSA
ncbi:MAG: hypothetical protein HY265_00085 [Deltaproteobacteria bacterium]|nr:hypothetical protein [Deltaproteobacteria bacterium]